MKNIKKKLKEYLNSSVHYGHKVNELNFNMIPYVLTKQNGYHIININKIIKCLFLAGEILKEKMLNKNNILFVGTNKNFSYLIKKFTKKSKVFYINNRWLGGTLTNWITIKKSISKLNVLEKILLNNNLSKKENIKLKRKLYRLKYLFEGIKNMKNLPDIVIFIDQLNDYLGIKECLKLGIPTICIVDTNCNPNIISYPIPGNDDSIKSVSFILNYLVKKINEIN